MARLIDGDRAFRRVAARIAPYSRHLLVISIAGGVLLFLAYIGFEANVLPRTTFLVRLVWLVAFVTVESCVVYWFGWLYGPNYEEAVAEDDWIVRNEYPPAFFFLAILAGLGFVFLYLAW